MVMYELDINEENIKKSKEKFIEEASKFLENEEKIDN